MISVEDLGRIKLAMLRKLDSTLRQTYHQTLLEVLNELRMRSIVLQPDPSPDTVFSLILQTQVLAHKSTPSVLLLRKAMERIEHGKYGLCVRCGRSISTNDLLKDPTLSHCSYCQMSPSG